MKIFSTYAAIAGMATIAHAHMQMKEPPPFRSKFNKNAGSNIDYSMTSPLEASGVNYPCKGYHKDFGTPAGKPVAEWTPGQSYKMSITGGASHGGGSCQASLSFDRGASWKVIHSYIGNCPLTGESNFDFKVPADTPGGDAIFAWTWFNKIGNREMYMNCAAITIKSPSVKMRNRAASVAMSARPKAYVANLGTDQCKTIEGTDLDFPEPGPDVTRNSHVAKGPSCASGSGGGSGGNNGNTGGTGGDNGNPPPSKTTLPGGVFITTSAGSQTYAVAGSPAQTTTPASSAAPPASGGSDCGSSYSAGTACSQDGQWNCIGGKQFQRCASGTWSSSLAVAAGTSCSPGLSMNMAIY